jgi:hypothetical protein
MCGRLMGGSRASLSVGCSPPRTVPLWALGGLLMFALLCSQPSDRPAPHPAVTSALPPRRNPVTGVVSVFPLSSSLNGMWFQVHAVCLYPRLLRLSLSIMISKRLYVERYTQCVISDCGFWLPPKTKRCNISGSSFTTRSGPW